MKYDDLEKTQDLFALNEEVPEPIDNIEMEGANKEHVTDELDFGLAPDSKEEETVKGAKEIKKPKKEKKKLKDKWNNLGKKKKIIIISSLILFLVLIIGLILFLVLKPNDRLEEEKNKPNEPVVIIEEDNYRFEDGTLVFLDKNKNELGKYECENKDEKLCFIAPYSDEDNFDQEKAIYETGEAVPKKSKIYFDNYVFIYDNVSEEEGFINLYDIKEGKSLGIYKLVKGFTDNNYVILKDKNDKYGAILFTEEGVESKLDFTFNYLGRLSANSNLVAKSSNKYFIYKEDGKLLNKGLEYEVKSYNNNYVVVNNDGYYVYDYKGELIFDDAYDYISLLDDYVIMIKDQKLYVKDYQNNKYNEEGITLSNKNYNLTKVYDKNKRLIETRSAFGVKVENETINISYKSKNAEKNELINIYEGKLNSKFAFMNYFDSTIYFYKDEDKKELIGKYKCANKNTIDKDTTTLNSCMVASESYFSINDVQNKKNGILPIFNERYVFIIDYLDKANKIVNLYDLKTNKTLVKYNSVDAGIHEETDNLSLVQEPVVYIMAQNRNKKYGVIKMDEEVTGLISFDYVNMEKIKDYFLTESSQETYMLHDKKGNMVTEKLGRKIVDYEGNYLKTLSDDKYYICDFNGETNDFTGYLDITLKPDYYVKITSSYELDLGKYDDISFSLSSPIYIGPDYLGNYDVTKKDDGSYRIIIKSTGEVYDFTKEGIRIISGD